MTLAEVKKIMLQDIWCVRWVDTFDEAIFARHRTEIDRLLLNALGSAEIDVVYERADGAIRAISALYWEVHETAGVAFYEGLYPLEGKGVPFLFERARFKKWLTAILKKEEPKSPSTLKSDNTQTPTALTLTVIEGGTSADVLRTPSTSAPTPAPDTAPETNKTSKRTRSIEADARRKACIETVIAAAMTAFNDAQRRKWSAYRMAKDLLQRRGVREIAGFKESTIKLILNGTYRPALALGIMPFRDRVRIPNKN